MYIYTYALVPELRSESKWEKTTCNFIFNHSQQSQSQSQSEFRTQLLRLVPDRHIKSSTEIMVIQQVNGRR